MTNATTTIPTSILTNGDSTQTAKRPALWRAGAAAGAVSYTHLTLPTNREV